MSPFQRKTPRGYRRVRPVSIVLGCILANILAEVGLPSETTESPPIGSADSTVSATADADSEPPVDEGSATDVEQTSSGDGQATQNADNDTAEELPAPAAGATPLSPSATAPQTWRFRWRNGHWWYWLKSKRWVWWDGAAWRPYVATDYTRWCQERRLARAREGISGARGPAYASPGWQAPAPEGGPAYRYETPGRIMVPQSRAWIVAPGYHPPRSGRSIAEGVFGTGRGVSGPGGGFDPPTSSGIGVY